MSDRTSEIITDRRIIKLAVLGDGYVGKTALLRRYKGLSFNPTYKMTMGADFVVKRMNTDDQDITLQIWDVGGQPKFSKLRSRYYSDAKGVLIVFDLMRWETFESIQNWLMEVLENNEWKLVPMILVGNKDDLLDNETPEVTKEDIENYENDLRNWGQQNIDPNFLIDSIITSAKSGHNVDETFDRMLEMIMSKD